MENYGANQKEKIALREKYLNYGINSMSELEVLKLFLFYAVKSDDIDETAEKLYEYFDRDLEKIFNADIEEIGKIDGLGDRAAVLFHLLNDVQRLVAKSENESVKLIDSPDTAKEYLKNVLASNVYEKIVLITLTDKNEIINCSEISNGTVNYAGMLTTNVFKRIINDGATSVIIAHNHPKGAATPSREDIGFTERLSSTLKSAGIKLRDHIIVGANQAYSMREDSFYSQYFE